MAKKEQIAVIDLGTNSARVLLAEILDGKIISRRKRIITTRLGEGVNESKQLTDRAIRDTIDAVDIFTQIITEKGYLLKKIIGTSALRDVSNADVLLKTIEKNAGVSVDIISGDQEAHYGYQGVVNSIESSSSHLVIDIGGGSTEFIIGTKSIELMESLDVGAVRMTDACIIRECPSEVELECLKKEVHKILEKIKPSLKKYTFHDIIGIGGTITTLSAIKQSLEVYDPEKVQGSSVTITELNDMIRMFINKTLDERKEIIGLQPKRADIIIAGSIILKEILKEISASKIIVSDFDNLEGIIYDEFI